VQDKVVLDIACGEGYGSYILANNSKSVIGMDIDSSSITHANNKYNAKNLEYKQGSCLSIPLDDKSVDVIVSFETLEHLAEHDTMLSEFNRVLKNDGIVVISTPDKKYYSDATGFTNEFHVKELYKDEFKSLLDAHWNQQIWYSQDLSFNSIMEKVETNGSNYSSDILNGNDFIKDKNIIKPMYHIVIASKNKVHLSELPDLHLFADTEQSIYKHYNEVIKNVIDYGEQLNKLRSNHQKLLAIPVLGSLIKYFEKKI
jgi:ubiquinone/menaquinone biosynthesis C-methylase UbiE